MTIFYDKHIFIYFNKYMQYCRGHYYNIIILSMFFPIIGYLFLNINLFIKSNNYVEKNYIKSIILFSIPPILGQLLTIFIPYPFILLCSITISIILLYLTIQDICITNDLLTGINNRVSLEKYFFNEKNKIKYQYLFLIDINKFKLINDNYGHLMGDNALIMLSNFLKQIVSEKGTIICRYGGDEFILITNCKNNKEADLIKKYVNEKLAIENEKYNYNFNIKISIGYSKYKNEYTLKKWIDDADKCMYKEKNNIKKF